MIKCRYRIILFCFLNDDNVEFFYAFLEKYIHLLISGCYKMKSFLHILFVNIPYARERQRERDLFTIAI